MALRASSVEIDPDLIARFGMSGPRYTSYPTADRFNEAYDAASHGRALAERKGPLGLYVHVPFCASICYYCACNKIVTKDRSRSAEYVRYLIGEIELAARLIGGARTVTEVHWGGGTPTFLQPAESAELMSALRANFDIRTSAELAIEIDPRTTDAASIGMLAGLGFNRASLGVQDFDPAVQRAVNRIQPASLTFEALAAARANGFRSVNLDLIYGLPKQSSASFARTLDQVIEAAPDRIALYNYAHLPERFGPQRRINAEELPSPAERLAIFRLAVERLGAAGYVYIGLDHFARPDDDLACALREGRLQRNFQGYASSAVGDLLALGVSAISRIGPTYAQNEYTLDRYYEALDGGRLPTRRGVRLDADDLLRRAVIMALMCQGELVFADIDAVHGIDSRAYFADELEALEEHAALGLIERTRDAIIVRPKGRLLIRPVCMVFDRYARASTARYSKVI